MNIKFKGLLHNNKKKWITGACKNKNTSQRIYALRQWKRPVTYGSLI